MTITLNLSPDLEEKLKDAARVRGVPLEVHALEILDRGLALTPEQRAAGLGQLFDEFAEEDDDGDATWDEVFRRIDESRGEGRKHFPSELKDVTW